MGGSGGGRIDLFSDGTGLSGKQEVRKCYFPCKLRQKAFTLISLNHFGGDINIRLI